MENYFVTSGIIKELYEIINSNKDLLNVDILPEEISRKIILGVLSDDKTEQLIFDNLLNKMKINKNVYKFKYDINMSIPQLKAHIKNKNYHTLLRCILTNNYYIICNIASFSTHENDIDLLLLCTYYMEIHHKEKLDEFYINVFLNMLFSVNIMYVSYIPFFSTFDWYYEQYDIFLINIMLRNNVEELCNFITTNKLNKKIKAKTPILISVYELNLIIKVSIENNLTEIFIHFYQKYFKTQKKLVEECIVLCILHNNIKIIKYILKKIKIRNMKLKNNLNNKVCKFLNGYFNSVTMSKRDTLLL